MPNSSYDVRSVPFGEELINEVSAVLSEDFKTSLRQVVATGSLAEFLQLPAAQNPEFMSIGELSDTGSNEEAEQFIDQNALRKVLLGRHGIAKSRIKGVENCKLALPIQLSYLKAPYTTQITRPVISSGRHRLLATQALLTAANISWKDIRNSNMRITTVVVADDKQFSQLMENNNTSRRQSQHELKVHSLSSKGIPTSDIDTMLDFTFRATDAQTQVEFFSQLVSLISRSNSDPSFSFSVAKNSWNLVKSTNKTNRVYAKKLFSDSESLYKTAELIARNIPLCTEKAQTNPLSRNIMTPVSRMISEILAQDLNIEIPKFCTTEEEVKQRIEKQRAALEQMEALLIK